MIRLICIFVSWFLPMVRLGKDGAYMHRYFVIRTPWRNVFLHRFLRADSDPELHNHMWNGKSLILWGSYREEKARTIGSWTSIFINMEDQIIVPLGSVVDRIFRPGDVNVLNVGDFHRVDLLTHEVWTLFVTGPKKQADWGFVDRNTGVYIDQETFITARDGRPALNID